MRECNSTRCMLYFRRVTSSREDNAQGGIVSNSMQTMRLIRLRINRLFGLSGVSSTRKKIVYIVAGVIVVFLLYRFFAASDGETVSNLLTVLYW